MTWLACVSGSYIMMAQFLGENWAHYGVTYVCIELQGNQSMYTYSHKTSPGFCAELSHRQSIHIMVRGDLLVRSFCLQLMTYIPLFLKLQMHAWIKKNFFFGGGGMFHRITVCLQVALMVPIMIIIYRHRDVKY